MSNKDTPGNAPQSQHWLLGYWGFQVKLGFLILIIITGLLVLSAPERFWWLFALIVLFIFLKRRGYTNVRD